MKYRVTTRGWVVFSVVGILLLALIVSSISNLTETPDDNETPVAETSTEENSVPAEDSEEEVSTESEQSTEIEEETAQESTESEEEAESEETTSVEPDQTVDWSKRTEVLYDKNVAELDADYHNELDEWVLLLKEHNNLQITIEGHINGYPYYEDGDFGMNLAQERADVIKAYFVTNGIDESNIRLINMGSNSQVDKSDNINNHYLNRRAVIYLVEKP